MSRNLEDITVFDVVEKYTNERPSKRQNRCKCPLHKGKGLNFSYSETGWTCFSRCGSGNAITFVALLFNEDTTSATKRIIQDFDIDRNKSSFYGEDIRELKVIPVKVNPYENKERWIAGLHERYDKLCNEIHLVRELISNIEGYSGKEQLLTKGWRRYWELVDRAEEVYEEFTEMEYELELLKRSDREKVKSELK